jgi:hypothetical protein
MQIEVLSTSVEDKGKYKQLEVAYKGGDGKVNSKKIMSFASPDVFKLLSSSKQGDLFSIEAVKNDKGYWDWKSASQGTGTVKAATTGNPAPRSTYETPEERAQRQVLIIRQSSVSSAIEFLKLNPKKVPSIQEVLEVASVLENHVFGKRSVPEKTGMEALTEMSDDVPL